jgi:hypothetical protein
MPNPRHARTLLSFFAVFAVAVLWVLFWSSRYTDELALRNDAATYFSAATGILDGTRNRLLTDASGATFSDVAWPNALSIWFGVVGSASAKAGQILVALLWGLSSCLVFRLLSRFRDRRRTLIVALLCASSPALTSFGGKLYSEHLAIASGLVSLSGFLGLVGRRRFEKPAAAPMLAALLGGLVLVLTKSAYFPFFIVLSIAFLLRRNLPSLAAAALVVLAALPVQEHLHRGKRGAIQIACQTAKLDLLDTKTILKCGVYNLSLSLGQKAFPEIEGDCRTNVAGLGLPGTTNGYETLAFQRVAEGFSYSDGVKKALGSPFKYALLGLTMLPTAAWIEGFYPDPIADLPGSARMALWLFKVGVSTSLWTLAILFLARSRRMPRFAAVRVVLLAVFAYVFAFQMNVPGEQRYFFPLIPLLYLSAGLFLELRRPTQSPNSAPTESASARSL